MIPAYDWARVAGRGGRVRISRRGWAPRRWSRLTTALAAGGPQWSLAVLLAAYSTGGIR